MQVLSWFSIAALFAFLALFIYWSWNEEQGRPSWVRYSFYGGIGFFTLVFFALSWNTVAQIPARTHAESLTPQVVAGKLVWQKYVCIDCHTMLGNGAYFGPDLTKAWTRFVNRAGGNEPAARAALVTFLQNPPQPTRDRRGMFQFHMAANEAEQLAAFLQWTSRIDTNGWPPEPLRPANPPPAPAVLPVTADTAPGRQLLAERGCLACHSIGKGTVVGPDLNGVGSRYDRAMLERWTEDPAAIYREHGRRPMNPGYPEMPSLHTPPNDAEQISEYLATLVGGAHGPVPGTTTQQERSRP